MNQNANEFEIGHFSGNGKLYTMDQHNGNQLPNNALKVKLGYDEKS